MTKHKRSVNNCLLTVLRCLVKPTQNEQNNVHAIMDVCCYYFECSFCDQTSRTRIIATLYFLPTKKMDIKRNIINVPNYLSICKDNTNKDNLQQNGGIIKK